MPRENRYAHWQQQPDEELLDYEPEPGFYAPPDPPTILEHLERHLCTEYRRHPREEEACQEP